MKSIKTAKTASTKTAKTASTKAEAKAKAKRAVKKPLPTMAARIRPRHTKFHAKDKARAWDYTKRLCKETQAPIDMPQPRIDAARRQAADYFAGHCRATAHQKGVQKQPVKTNSMRGLLVALCARKDSKGRPIGATTAELLPLNSTAKPASNIHQELASKLPHTTGIAVAWTNLTDTGGDVVERLYMIVDGCEIIGKGRIGQ